jgi:hypothetical protein
MIVYVRMKVPKKELPHTASKEKREQIKTPLLKTLLPCGGEGFHPGRSRQMTRTLGTPLRNITRLT